MKLAASRRPSSPSVTSPAARPRFWASIAQSGRPSTWVRCSGGLPVGIYTTCSAPEVQYIVDHREALAVLVENEAQWEKIAAERERLPKLVRVITMKGAASIDDELVQTWDEFLASGDAIPSADIDERIAAITPESLGTLIYVWYHGAPRASCSRTRTSPGRLPARTRSSSWARRTRTSPTSLSHIAEQIFTIRLPISVGSRVYFAESIEKLPANLGEVHPSIFFGVPRVWEKFHAKISTRLDAATGLKARLAAWARSVASRVHAERNAGREPKGTRHPVQAGLTPRVRKATCGDGPR